MRDTVSKYQEGFIFSVSVSLFFSAYLGGNGWIHYYRYKIAIITANLMKRWYIIWRLYLFQLKAYGRFNQAREDNSLMEDKLLFEYFYSLIHSYKNTILKCLFSVQLNDITFSLILWLYVYLFVFCNIKSFNLLYILKTALVRIYLRVAGTTI